MEVQVCIRIVMIKKLLKIENLIILLVAVSAIAIAVYQWIPREYSIRPGDSWKTLAVADKYECGNSNAIDESNDSEFAYRYNIHEGNKNPFALLFFHPAEGDKLFDWRWMETISITAYIEGKERENYRLHLRNREEELFSPDENISRKYNQASLQLTNRPTTQTVSLDQFSVPGWWLEQVKMTPENVTPCFDNIEWVEFNTANVPTLGKCRVVIQEIKISGKWISGSLFYKSMLGLWLGFGSLVALSQIVLLRKELTKSASIELSLQRQKAELAEIAILDPLTQLFNRRGLRSHSTSAMKELRKTGKTFSLIMFDIDDFKSINDENGHSYGDQILQRVAVIVSETVTSNDPAARWGGEEFLMVCKDSELQRACTLAEEIREKIEREVEITCSFGVCEVGPDLEFGEALDLADECLYLAKRSGKNCIKTPSSVSQTQTPLLTKQAAIE